VGRVNHKSSGQDLWAETHKCGRATSGPCGLIRAGRHLRSRERRFVGWGMPSANAKNGQGQVFAVRTTSSMNKASIPDLRKVTIASVGVQTIGSLSLKDVLMTIGTPVRAWKQEMSS
jgi:hypothetical protein